MLNTIIRNKFIDSSEYLRSQLHNNNYDDVVIPPEFTPDLITSCVNNNITNESFPIMANMADMLIIKSFWTRLNFQPSNDALNTLKTTYPHVHIPKWIEEYHESLIEDVNEFYFMKYAQEPNVCNFLIADVCISGDENLITKIENIHGSLSDEIRWNCLVATNDVKRLQKYYEQHQGVTIELSKMILYAIFRDYGMSLAWIVTTFNISDDDILRTLFSITEFDPVNCVQEMYKIFPVPVMFNIIHFVKYNKCKCAMYLADLCIEPVKNVDMIIDVALDVHNAELVEKLINCGFKLPNNIDNYIQRKDANPSVFKSLYNTLPTMNLHKMMPELIRHHKNDFIKLFVNELNFKLTTEHECLMIFYDNKYYSDADWDKSDIWNNANIKYLILNCCKSNMIDNAIKHGIKFNTNDALLCLEKGRLISFKLLEQHIPDIDKSDPMYLMIANLYCSHETVEYLISQGYKN
jgi:hypothetical protein